MVMMTSLVTVTVTVTVPITVPVLAQLLINGKCILSIDSVCSAGPPAKGTCRRPGGGRPGREGSEDEMEGEGETREETWPLPLAGRIRLGLWVG